jgi:antitoxin MazE
MATTQLAKWGNSLALRIPKSLADGAELKEGDPVRVSIVSGGSLVIKRARRRYSLRRLVARINARNRHEESDWGPAVGKEIW